MACFVAPASAAIAATVVRKKIPAKYQINKLLLMLWGGTAMLVVDHVLNGEIVPDYPFFTAGFAQIWHEILRVGVPMTAVIFSIWAVMVIVSAVKKERALSGVN